MGLFHLGPQRDPTSNSGLVVTYGHIKKDEKYKKKEWEKEEASMHED